MHTVLIQNQRTLESFQHYYPLFMDAINEGRISVCQWMEAGDLVEAAVPELYQVIDGKDEWRAIIVHTEKEQEEIYHPTAQGNPYDYLEYKDNDAFIGETSIPLIHLTRLLGGMPMPPIRFDSEIITEMSKAPRVVYRPSLDKDEQREYQELCKKYHFNGHPPTEIILVSPLIKNEAIGRDVRKAWKNELEINSSEFWKRNGYPSSCRFIVYKMDRRGESQRSADLFKLWSSVLLLATNTIDSSTLQAYRLHSMDIDFDKKEMNEVFQKTVNRAKSAKRYIKKNMEKELHDKINAKAELPDYHLEAPVVIDFADHSKFSIKRGDFGLVAGNETSASSKWARLRQDTEIQLDNAILSADRALDHTAGKIRLYCHYSDDEVKQLDYYQKEDMNRELDRTYGRIFELRSELPNKSALMNKELQEIEKNIRQMLRKYVMKGDAILSFVIVVGFMMLSFLPALFYNIHFNWGAKSVLGLSLLTSIVISLIVELTLLLFFKSRLRREIGKYFDIVKRIIVRIAENGSRYSDYMTNIATYTHGISYLSVIKKKIYLRDETEFRRRKHLVALDAFIANLRTWSTSLHLGVDFEREELNEGLTINTAISPLLNPIYTFDHLGSSLVEVNSSGDYLESQFSFVDKVTIVREDLYDDDEQ